MACRRSPVRARLAPLLRRPSWPPPVRPAGRARRSAGLCERAVGQLGRLRPAQGLVPQGQREQHLAASARDSGCRAADPPAAAREPPPAASAAFTPPPNSRPPGCLSGIVATIAPVAGLTTADLAAQPVPLQRQAVARQPQVAELRRQLHERRHLRLVAQLRCGAARSACRLGQRRDPVRGRAAGTPAARAAPRPRRPRRPAADSRPARARRRCPAAADGPPGGQARSAMQPCRARR